MTPTSPTTIPLTPPVPRSPTSLVWWPQSRTATGKRWVTFKVFARCAESLVERPIPLSLKITAEAGSQLQRDIEAFDRYGTPFSAPAGTADAELDLPGSPGGAFTGGSVRLEPAPGAGSTGYDIRLQ